LGSIPGGGAFSFFFLHASLSKYSMPSRSSLSLLHQPPEALFADPSLTSHFKFSPPQDPFADLFFNLQTFLKSKACQKGKGAMLDPSTDFPPAAEKGRRREPSTYGSREPRT